MRPEPASRRRTATGPTGARSGSTSTGASTCAPRPCDGTRVNYVEMGEGPPLVFVHGLVGLLAELAREHPVLRAQPPRDRDGPAGFGSPSSRNEEISIPGYGRFVDAFLERSASSARRSSATRWAASSRPRPRSPSEPGRRLVLVSAAGGYPSARAATGSALSALARSSARRRARDRPPRALDAPAAAAARCSLYGIVRYPVADQPELCTRSRAGAGKPGSWSARRARSTTTSATGCPRSRTRR